MSTENCKLCNQDSTPWVHINGHICEDCYANTKRLWSSDKMSWISVKDKLPDDYNEVLYCAIDNMGTHEIMTGHREKGKWTHCCLFYSTITLPSHISVTHWMPLPEPPQ